MPNSNVTKCVQEDDNRIAIYSGTFASSLGSHIYCPDYGDFESGSSVDSQRQAKCSEAANEATTDAIMDVCHGKSKHMSQNSVITLRGPVCTKPAISYQSLKSNIKVGRK